MSRDVTETTYLSCAKWEMGVRDVLNNIPVCKTRLEWANYLDEEQGLQEEKKNSAGHAKEKNLAKGRGGTQE